jgi:hypothetical protein
MLARAENDTTLLAKVQLSFQVISSQNPKEKVVSSQKMFLSDQDEFIIRNFDWLT